MRLFLYIFLVVLPFGSTSAQEVSLSEKAILTYRKIVLQDTVLLGLLQDAHKKCVVDLKDEFDCLRLFNSIYLGFEMRGQDWNALLNQAHRHYPDITFIDEMRMEEIAAIISFNRLVSLQLKKVIEPGSSYSPIKNSAAYQLLAIMDLHPDDRVGVIQKDDDVIGELVASTSLNHEVVIYDRNTWRIKSLFKLSPVSSEPSWKTPRYVYTEDLKISNKYNHNKVLLNEVLSHNEDMKPMLRRLTLALKINDDVIVFEHIGDCCDHGKRCKEARSAEKIERLFTSRSFRLIEKKEVGHYLLARFKYAPF